MRKIIDLYFIYLIFVSSILSAQVFQGGYVVTIDGDTLQGQVALSFDDEDQRIVLLTQQGPDDLTAYSSKEAVAFGSSEYIYRSSLLRITQKDGSIKEFHSFAEVLIDGELVLYHFWFPSHRGVYFLQENQEPLVELTNVGKLQMIIDEVPYEQQDRRYINILTRHLYHPLCPDIHTQIDESLYTKKHLMKLIKAWYTCTGKSCTYVREKTGRGIQFDSFQATTSLHAYDRDRSRDRKYSLGPAIELAAEFRPKRYSLWRLHTGMELVFFAPISQNKMFMVPICIKRYQEINTGPFKGGSFYAKGGIAPFLTFNTPEIRDQLAPKTFSLWLISAGYEISSQSKHPIFIEWRHLLPIRAPQIPSRPFELFCLRMGVKL